VLDYIVLDDDVVALASSNISFINPIMALFDTHTQKQKRYIFNTVDNFSAASN